MQGLSTLSQQLANTAGTAFAPQSASQLQQYCHPIATKRRPPVPTDWNSLHPGSPGLASGEYPGGRPSGQPGRRRSPALCSARIPTHPKRKLIGRKPSTRSSERSSRGLGRSSWNLWRGPNIAGPWNHPIWVRLLGAGQAYRKSLATGQNPGTALNNGGSQRRIKRGGSVACNNWEAST